MKSWGLTILWLGIFRVGITQPAGQTPTTNMPGMGWLVIKTLFVLALIVVLIFALVWAMKKLLGRNLGVSGEEGWFQILARVPLHQNQSIALVKVVDRVLLLGITEHCITNLGEVPDSPIIQKMLQNPVNQTVSGSVFQTLLKGKLH